MFEIQKKKCFTSPRIELHYKTTITSKGTKTLLRINTTIGELMAPFVLKFPYIACWLRNDYSLKEKMNCSFYSITWIGVTWLKRKGKLYG